jgi:hypothetical protein
MSLLARALAASLVAGALVGSRADAQVACSSLPNPVYLQVGDTQEPLMKTLGRALRDEERPITVVYVTSGSCTNIQAIYSGIPNTKAMSYVPSTSENAAWTSDMPALPCTVPAEGVPLDVANSALFVSSCSSGQGPVPAGLKLFRGPVQGYSFVVPRLSSEVAITAEEAYFVFGFGNAGMAQPWTDEAQLFIRTATKSTLLTMAAVIGVGADKWRGTRFDGSPMVLSALKSSPTPERALGILGVEIYEKNRQDIKLLAFKGYGQNYAYFPDSNATAFDKRNLRDGHYLPWSPTVWITKVDGAGEPVDPDAAYIIDMILANDASPKPKFEPIDIAIKVGLVPECAMTVTREHEAGELSRYQPEEPCGCYFEARSSGKAPASCVACTESTPCATGTCRHGYCETR